MIVEKKWWLPLFLAMLFAQIAIPAYMVYEEEAVVLSGTAYKFKTAAVDPSDPFRGRYLTLRFEADNLEIDTSYDWKRKQTVYVQISEDKEGFVQVEGVSPSIPSQGDYVLAKVNRIQRTKQAKLIWDYPFDRFYMQEFQSLKGEQIYRNAARDTSSIAYALVMVKGSKATLTDVVVNDTSIVTLSRIYE